VKLITTIISICLAFILTSQVKPNAIIKNEAYTAYIDTTIKMPVYVQYKLYNGGGSCERSNHWINDSKYKLVGEDSYASSGYDKGHLANAEDFAYDCHLDSLTFMQYNRLPQTKGLNRGLWKKQETLIRTISKKDSLWIICGGYWDPSSTKIINGMAIPTRYWKVVFSLTTGDMISGNIYTNTENAMMYEVSLENLELMLGYKLDIPPSSKKKKKKKK
jgi:endonuclease G